MYLVKTPPIIKTIFSDYVWSIPTESKEIFLTFDDGPVPDVTPWVLDILAEFNYKATFFCVGQNVQKYPAIFERIISEGHAVGNHTFNHVNGWLTDKETYIQNIKLCDEYVDSPLFRPPYGKMRPGQASWLKSDKTIVMWDILSGDFDLNITQETCLDNVINNYEPGSIVVFHDSLKAEEKLRYVLPKFLRHLNENGFSANVLRPEIHHHLSEV